MAYETKTSIGRRNVVVQRGALLSTTVWLEIQAHEMGPEINCLALTGDEAREVGMALIMAGTEAASIALDEMAYMVATEG
jgi:hypothetical protein